MGIYKINATTFGARAADNRPTGFVLPASVDVGAKWGQTLPLETRAAHDGRNYNFFTAKHANFVPIIRLTEWF